ncbi:uncharacterized protein LOC114363896 [Ostrinia furnacalis]|uniref:uncharacterized protein LOC114363896 n=1 Tax=Ostrinia furnacalis TaxID=93504 RepID=UPI00103F2F11|nr:uncharacterized protein LOC114363896 [Ostrinia furnacalis]
MNFSEPWNDPSILPPPINTFKVDVQINARDILHLCNNINKVLANQSPLHQESALLSRFVYKFDKKFRNDIGYRHLKKLNTALRIYLGVNLWKDVESFAAVIPVDNQNKYLPTRQMLEYVLVRIISFAKVMKRICLCSKQSSVFYLDRVKRGESHWMSLMPYALLSRIWSISSVLLQHSCTWYSGLYPYLSKLIFKGVQFLPPNYALPLDLRKWIDLKNLDDCGRFEWTHKKGIVNMNLSEDDSTIDTILEYVNDINDVESVQENAKKSVVSNFISPKENSVTTTDMIKKEVDQGEIISREHFKSLISKQTMQINEKESNQGEKISREYFKSFFVNKPTDKMNEKESKHSADNVTSNQSLDKFINTEEKYRNEDGDLALTKHLSFMQWQSLRTSLLNLKESLSKNRKIERKFQKLWKEKCLDYK